MLSKSEEATVVEIHGGKGIVRRLSEMGFTYGTKVRMLSVSPGPVLVSIKGSRIALGRGLAMKIMVTISGMAARR